MVGRSHFKSASRAYQKIIRLDARTLSPTSFAEWDGKQPILLSNALGTCEEDSVKDAWERWRKNLMVVHGSRPLRYVRRKPDGNRESAWTQLSDFMQIVEAKEAFLPEPGLFAFEQDPE